MEKKKMDEATTKNQTDNQQMVGEENRMNKSNSVEQTFSVQGRTAIGAKEGDTEMLRERNIQIVLDQNEALANGDTERMRSLWADDAVYKSLFVMEPMPADKAPQTLIGGATIVEYFSQARLVLQSSKLNMQLIDTLASDPNRVLARFSGDNVLKDGRTYNNEYNNLIRVRDGKIIEWVEVMNPLIWLKTFGT